MRLLRSVTLYICFIVFLLVAIVFALNSKPIQIKYGDGTSLSIKLDGIYYDPIGTIANLKSANKQIVLYDSPLGKFNSTRSIEIAPALKAQIQMCPQMHYTESRCRYFTSKNNLKFTYVPSKTSGRLVSKFDAGKYLTLISSQPLDESQITNIINNIEYSKTR